MTRSMLAVCYDPAQAVFPMLISHKLDGVRCIITENGPSTRTGTFKKL